MQTQKVTKKLTLQKETLHELTESEAAVVVGGICSWFTFVPAPVPATCRGSGCGETAVTVNGCITFGRVTA